MDDSSADGVSGPQILVRGSKINQEASKFHANLGTSASYDPRKLYLRENLYSRNEKESSSGSKVDNVDNTDISDTSSDGNQCSNSKRKMDEDSHQDDDKKRRIETPALKKYLLYKGPLYDSKQNLQNMKESSPSSCDSCSDSDTEVSSSCSSDE